MNNRPKDPKTARNKNVLVIGGSGSGKTRFFVKPNLMQCVSKDYPTSFVITDPKGSLIGEVGQLLVRSGYRVKVLNVGLYVGNSVMLHCGDPISYTNLNSSYWQSHLYCYGRLP